MGLFDKIKEFFKKLTGKKEEKEEVVKKTKIKGIELPSMPLEENIGKEEDPLKRAIGIKPKKKVDKEIEEEEDLPEKKKIVTGKRDIERFSKSDVGGVSKKEIIERVDKIGYIEKGKEFESKEDLNKNIYDLYRGYIMESIKDDKVAEAIYKTGVLSNRITAYISISGQDSNGRGFNEVLPIPRLSPEEVLNKGLYDLKGNSLNPKILEGMFRRLGYNGGFFSEFDSKDVLTIIDIKISFDFA